MDWLSIWKMGIMKLSRLEGRPKDRNRGLGEFNISSSISEHFANSILFPFSYRKIKIAGSSQNLTLSHKVRRCQGQEECDEEKIVPGSSPFPSPFSLFLGPQVHIHTQYQGCPKLILIKEVLNVIF